MKPIKCFIFDLDGTLVFNRQANFEAYKKSFASVGLSLKKGDMMHHLNSGGNIDEIYQDYAKKYNILASQAQLQKIKQTKTKEYVKIFHLIEKNHAIASILEALSKHYHTALATTASKKNAMPLLEYFGLDKLFSLMVFGEDVGRKKPDPECHHKIAKHFGVKPEECLIFEDSTKGFAAAEAFGAHLCKVVQ